MHGKEHINGSHYFLSRYHAKHVKAITKIKPKTQKQIILEKWIEFNETLKFDL